MCVFHKQRGIPFREFPCPSTSRAIFFVDLISKTPTWSRRSQINPPKEESLTQDFTCPSTCTIHPRTCSPHVNTRGHVDSTPTTVFLLRCCQPWPATLATWFQSLTHAKGSFTPFYVQQPPFLKIPGINRCHTTLLWYMLYRLFHPFLDIFCTIQFSIIIALRRSAFT